MKNLDELKAEIARFSKQYAKGRIPDPVEFVVDQPAAPALYAKLKAHLKQDMGYTFWDSEEHPDKAAKEIAECDRGGRGTLGVHMRERHIIVLNPKLTITQQFRTLIHEVTHALQERDMTPEGRRLEAAANMFYMLFNLDTYERNLPEAEAELTAYLALGELGLPSEFSAPYFVNHRYQSLLDDARPKAEQYAKEIVGWLKPQA